MIIDFFEIYFYKIQIAMTYVLAICFRIYPNVMIHSILFCTKYSFKIVHLSNLEYYILKSYQLIGISSL